jgi:carotenoid cleavage dioxygenase-like enzyme
VNVRVIRRFESRLPPDDDHPYRTGAHRPTTTEYDATDLDVLHGEIPRDLEGVYLRNTENPLLPSLGRYHPFDGDGMIHAVHFHDGKADYRNRFVRTEGLLAELAAGEPLWAGIIDPPSLSKRDGWGARTRMKDAASTDVVVHNGLALATFFQCGDAHQLDPITLEDRGKARWTRRSPGDVGVSAHTKVDERTGELIFFDYSTEAPFLHFGVLSPSGEVTRYAPVPLPGPRLPHDIAFTEHYVILNDLPLFWDPAGLERGVYRARFFKELPSRFAVVPRQGDPSAIRWFEADPTYVLHWVNAYEEGDEVVLEGFHQANPLPTPQPGDGKYSILQRSLDMHAMGARLHRWRFDLETGKTREEPLDDRCAEFPMIHGAFGGVRHRYAYAMVGEPGWFLFSGLVRYDMRTGGQQRYAFPEAVFASESPLAPRTPRSSATDAEDDGYLVTFVSDVRNDTSECQIFDARDIARGPITRLRLPERIASGTHAYWAPASALQATGPAPGLVEPAIDS